MRPVLFKKLRPFFLLLFFLTNYAFLHGQEKPVRVADLGLLTGTWKQAHHWGDMTEIWSDTAGNNLMCTFRCVNNGELVFYEFMVIEQSANGPEMKLRHFSPGSIGWEEKDQPGVYQMVEFVKGKKVVFEHPVTKTRIGYERRNDTTLLAYLEKTGKDGKLSREAFNYQKVD